MQLCVLSFVFTTCVGFWQLTGLILLIRCLLLDTLYNWRFEWFCIEQVGMKYAFMVEQGALSCFETSAELALQQPVVNFYTKIQGCITRLWDVEYRNIAFLEELHEKQF